MVVKSLAKRLRKQEAEKLLEEGRGTGVGSEYKPWLRIQDVASSGRVTRLRGVKTGRQHEFLSDNERNYFYFLEYADCVIDIKEQFPLLPIEETLAIANDLGIEHPKNPKTGEYIVMTTDFLITINQSGKPVDVARTIKMKDKLLEKRVNEKFEIERIFWLKKEVDWAIVTEEEIDKTAATNISFFHKYYDIQALDAFIGIEQLEITDLVLEYLRRILASEKTIRSISSLFDQDMLLPKGTGISIFKHLLARKIIRIDLSEPINLDKKMDINLSKEEMKKELNIS